VIQEDVFHRQFKRRISLPIY